MKVLQPHSERSTRGTKVFTGLLFEGMTFTLAHGPKGLEESNNKITTETKVRSKTSRLLPKAKLPADL